MLRQRLDWLLASDAVAFRNSSLDASEHESFFQIAYQKDLALRKKQVAFSALGSKPRVAVVKSHANLENIGEHYRGEKIRVLDEEFFKVFDPSDTSHRLSLENTALVLTNNNLAKITPSKFAHVVESTPTTAYIIHDYDSHHWHEMSVQAALLADIYFPAHPVDHFLTSKVNPFIVRGVPCGTIQWTREFLFSRLGEMLIKSRSNFPLGRHFFYPRFKFRNQVIATLAKFSPHTGIQTENFHTLSPSDRWEDWASHKVHWIVPVQGDLPIRFFDALVTGGVPLVPVVLSDYIDSLGFRGLYLTYSPVDILEPAAVVNSALHLFDEGGMDARLERFHRTLTLAHVDRVYEKIMDRSLEILGYISGQPQ